MQEELDKCQINLSHPQTFVRLLVLIFFDAPCTHTGSHLPTNVSADFIRKPPFSPFCLHKSNPRTLVYTFLICIAYPSPFSFPFISMPGTESSSGSLSDNTFRSRLTDALHITGYHFVNATRISSVDRCNNNISLINGYR